MKKNRSYLPQHDKGHLHILRDSIMINGGKVKAFFPKIWENKIMSVLPFYSTFY